MHSTCRTKLSSMSSASPVISVTQLNRLARLALEKALPSCWISGEISNFTRANSGHFYFTLKDNQSAVKCAFFRNRNQFMDWLPVDGDKVEVRAQATLYEPRGDYQLLVEAMRRDGQGKLYEDFIRLKIKLESEGLFNEINKITPPRYPKRLGIITSLQAAALQDVLRTLELRWPSCPIIIYPASVQGTESAELIRQSLNIAIIRNECDVLLLVRGGGSLEDLRSFNDEQLARSIFASPIPVITGIGHETDFSIADFVADVRAATPTAAAQAAVPDRQEIQNHLLNSTVRIHQAISRRLDQNMQQLDGLTRRVTHPGNTVKTALKDIEQMKRRIQLSVAAQLSENQLTQTNLLNRFAATTPNLTRRHDQVARSSRLLGIAMMKSVTKRSSEIHRLSDSLKQLNPENVLARGYCLALNERNKIIKNVNTLHLGSKINVVLKSGKLSASVDSVSSSLNLND